MSTDYNLWIKCCGNTRIRITYIKNTKFVIEDQYDYEKIKEKNKVINNEVIEEFTKRIYKPSKLINLNSHDLEKEMDDYISIFE